MKKFLFALAIMPLLIVACSSDDDIPSSTDFDYTLDFLYGEWRSINVQSIGSPLDLTTPLNELYAPPTFLKFNKDGTLEGKGLFGEGSGKYSAKGKAIHTSIGKNKKTFEVISLDSKYAKVRLDAKGLGTLLIPDNAGMVTFTLEKDYQRTVNFDYPIKSLYGEWRAVRLEGLYDNPINLTDPVIEQELIKPAYITFKEDNSYTAAGFFGMGTGRYTTENEMIYTLIDNKKVDFKVIDLETGTARIELNPHDVDFKITIPASVETVTIVLKKEQ